MPAIIVLWMLENVRKSENEDQVKTELNKLEPNIEIAIKGLSKVGHEYEGLMDTAEKISGKKLKDMFTDEEVIQLLRDSQNKSRMIPK
ncbi:MAG: hypothetical protein H0U54_10455 [Acidobacteria bacterium]|nr:hypothetical protein [Acidobacteriota bacterium]